MELRPFAEKLHESINIFTYNRVIESKPVTAYLVVQNKWTKDNKEKIRNFFIHLFVKDSRASWSYKLKVAADGMAQTGNDLLAIVIDGSAIYASGYGEIELWMIRRLQVIRLLSGLENQTQVSGWLKPNDLFVPIIGIIPPKTIYHHLQTIAHQLRKSSDSDWSIKQIFQSTGFIFQAGFIQMVNNGELYADKLQASALNTKDKPIQTVSDSGVSKVFTQFTKGFILFKHVYWANLTNNIGLIKHSLLRVLEQLIYLVLKRIPAEETIFAVEHQQIAQRKQSRNRKMLFGLAIILLIGLSSSIGWGVKQRRQVEWQTQFGNLIEDFKYKVQEGKNIAELNPNRARDLISQAGNLVDVLKERGLSTDQLTSLQNELGVVLGLASGKKQADVRVWLNLALVRADMLANDMQIYEQDLVILDQEADRAVRIGLNDKSAKVLAGQTQLGQTQEIAIYADKVFVLSDLGITEITNDTQKLIINSDPEWGRVFDLQVFAGNIYLASETGIWKYPVIDSGFGVKQLWLADAHPDLSNWQAMTIDGFVWIAKPTELLKFARGIKDNFQIVNLEQGFSSIKAIYADEDSNYLYILNSDQKRIVLLDKQNGEYKQQYLAEEFANASDLVIKESEKLMLVLVKDKIFGVRLD